MTLTDDETAALDSLAAKETPIRDHVKGVIHCHHTGFWLWGDGGIGKSYSVIDELEKSKKPWRLTNSRLTGKSEATLKRLRK